MTILVTGANGQLGSEMRIVAASGVASGVAASGAASGNSDRYIFTDVVAPEGVPTTILDITNPDAVRRIVEENDVKVIVNCAAYTNVEAAESNEALAEKLNAGAPKILAEAMKSVGGLLVHISTDYVFGKEPYNVPCKEDQKGTPTGIYGLTKLHGEQNIIASECEYLILRTAWLYSEFGKNFCKTMLSLTATKPSLNVVFDQAGTPTYALDLAKAIYDIISKRKFVGNTGIYHYSNEGVCSWYDFTVMIASIAGHTSCDIRPCHSSEFPSAVVRPAYSVLDKTLFKETFKLPIPYWVNSLKECIANLV